MSMWHKIKKEDIEYDTAEKQFNILVCDNSEGNVYAEVPLDMLFQVLSERLEKLSPDDTHYEQIHHGDDL